MSEVNTDNELVGTLSGASTLEGTLTIPERLTIQANKTITPTDSQQVVGPDTGYDAMAQVTVGAIRLENKTVTPSDAVQTISAGENYDGLGVVTVEATAPATGIDFILSSAMTDNIPDYMFEDQAQLKSFKAHNYWGGLIGRQAFDDCTGLERVEFPKIEGIGADAFSGCTGMKDYYFGYKTPGTPADASQVPMLSSYRAIVGAAGYKIHVPADMVAYYRAASGWSNLASRIVGDYVIE